LKSGEQRDALYTQFDTLVRAISEKATEITGRDRNEVLYKMLATFFFAKGWKTFQSIYLLCSRQFAEDAAILVRSIFEMVVNLLYISKDPQNRALLFVEFDYIERQKRLDRLSKSPDDPWGQALLKSVDPATIETLVSEYNRVRARYPKDWLWSGESTKKMASDVGLAFHYDWIYWVLSDLAHTSPRAVKEYISGGRDGLTVGVESTEKDIDRVWFTACRYFLILVDKKNEALGLGFDDSIRTLTDTLVAIPARHGRR